MAKIRAMRFVMCCLKSETSLVIPRANLFTHGFQCHNWLVNLALPHNQRDKKIPLGTSALRSPKVKISCTDLGGFIWRQAHMRIRRTLGTVPGCLLNVQLLPTLSLSL